MNDNTGRPGSGDKGFPKGTRARNDTTLLGAEEVRSIEASVNHSSSVEPRTTNAESVERDIDSHEFDPFEQDDYRESPTRPAEFQGLDDIFGGVAEGDGRSQRQPEPFGLSDSAPRDASSTTIANVVLDDEFKAALEVFDSPLVTSAQPSAPRVVRTASENLKQPPQVPVTDVFDPFAALEADQSVPSTTPTEQAYVSDNDVHAAFEDPQIWRQDHEVSDVSVSAPKIVRSGDIGGANERLIVPPSHPVMSASGATEIGAGGIVSANQQTSAYQVAREAELMTEPRDHIFWKNDSPLIGFLVTYDHDPKGTYVELRQGRLVVSNQREDSGNCLVVVGESVSPMHAIMRIAPGGVVQVLDQLSESGTRVKHIGQIEEEFLSGEKSALSHGDILYFGDRKFHVLLVVGEVEEG